MITCLSQLLIHFWYYWNQLLGAMIWKISNAPNYEIEMFWKCSFGTCFRIFCESLRVFVFGLFTKWIIVFPSGLAVEYFHRVDVDEFNLEQNWELVWIWGFFSGFRDTFQNENVVHLLSIKNCHLVIQTRGCSIFIKLEGVLKINLRGVPF